MKIAILSNSSGGLYNFRRDLILRLIGDGHDVVALTPLDDRRDQLSETGIRLVGVEIDRRGMNPLRDLRYFFRCRRFFREERPDLVVTYTIKPNVYGGCACRLMRIPYAGNVTGLGTAFEGDGLLRKIVVLLNKVALRRAKCVFFENSENLRLFVDEKIIRKDRAVLLNGAGVNLAHFQYEPYPPEDKPFRFLFMGRLMREKGVEELFGAMQMLRAEGYDCTLDVLGDSEERFEDSIRQGEGQGWLRYHGRQSDVRPFIKNAHCFVLASYHEGMANVNLESAATGRPIVTSDIPGCREAVIEGKTGFLCKPKDAQSLYEAMKKMLALSNPERAEMGREGHAHMEAVFDKKKVVENTVRELYRA